MKHIISLFCALFCLQIAGAQDLILLQSAEEIRASVEEITEEEVIYRLWESSDTTQHRLLFKEIFRITYANGEVETFTDRIAANSVRVLKNYPYPAVSRTYAVGDIFDEDGIRGVVIQTTDGGRHGLILSLEEAPIGTQWDAARATLFYMGLDNHKDGWENMRKLGQAIEKNGLKWEDFPAFDYCRSLGEGWYLPAIEELMCMWNLIGEVPERMYASFKFDRLMKELSSALKAVGAYPLATLYEHEYLSSTEANAGHVYKLAYRKKGQTTLEGEKTFRLDQAGFKQNHWTKGTNKRFLQCCIRAVHKF